MAGAAPHDGKEVGAVAGAFDNLVADQEDADERVWIEQARVVFLVVYGLGLRRGEVLGLRWRSVRLADPEARPTLTVEAATVLGRDGAPKSQTSRRTLVLDEFLAGELFDHRGRSRYRGDGERVFCHPTQGSALDHKRYAETFRDALERAGSPTTSGRSTTAATRRSRTTRRPTTAGVEFAEEAERAAARAFAHVPRAKVRATDEAD
jgi:integrase